MRVKKAMASGIEPEPAGRKASALTTGLPIALLPGPQFGVIIAGAGITGPYSWAGWRVSHLVIIDM